MYSFRLKRRLCKLVNVWKKYFFVNSRFSVPLINKLKWTNWTYSISTAGYGYNYRLGIRSLARWPETIYSSRTPGVGHCTLYRKSEFWIPRNETARPRSQFLHSFICERLIYSQNRSAHLAAAKQADRSWEYIYRSQIHGCGNWETEHYNSVLELTRPCSFISEKT